MLNNCKEKKFLKREMRKFVLFKAVMTSHVFVSDEKSCLNIFSLALSVCENIFSMLFRFQTVWISKFSERVEVFSIVSRWVLHMFKKNLVLEKHLRKKLAAPKSLRHVQCQFCIMEIVVYLRFCTLLWQEKFPTYFRWLSLNLKMEVMALFNLLSLFTN